MGGIEGAPGREVGGAPGNFIRGGTPGNDVGGTPANVGTEGKVIVGTPGIVVVCAPVPAKQFAMLGFGTAAASASMGAVVAGGGTGVIAAMLALLKLAGNCVGGGGNSMEVLGKGAIGGGVVITLAGCDAEVVEVTSSVAVDILAAIFACNSVIFACEPDDAARALIAAALAAAI